MKTNFVSIPHFLQVPFSKKSLKIQNQIGKRHAKEAFQLLETQLKSSAGSYDFVGEHSIKGLVNLDWLTGCFGLNALSDSISVYIGTSVNLEFLHPIQR